MVHKSDHIRMSLDNPSNGARWARVEIDMGMGVTAWQDYLNADTAESELAGKLRQLRAELAELLEYLQCAS